MPAYVLRIAKNGRVKEMEKSTRVIVPVGWRQTTWDPNHGEFMTPQERDTLLYVEEIKVVA